MRAKKYIFITLIVISLAIILAGSRLQRRSDHLPVIQHVSHNVESGEWMVVSVMENRFSAQDDPENWESLFDGKTLDGWEIVRYGGEGQPYVRDGVLVLPRATAGTMTGVCWVGEALPVNNYIIYYEARRTEGFDIFAGLSFPYKDTYASLIFGGWAGIVNGLSSIDGYDASENETTQLFSFRDNIWYPVQLRVTTDYILATVGKEQVVDLATEGKELHLRPGLPDTGLTLWTYQSTGEIRNLRIKRLL